MTKEKRHGGKNAPNCETKKSKYHDHLFICIIFAATTKPHCYCNKFNNIFSNIFFSPHFFSLSVLFSFVLLTYKVDWFFFQFNNSKTFFISPCISIVICFCFIYFYSSTVNFIVFRRWVYFQQCWSLFRPFFLSYFACILELYASQKIFIAKIIHNNWTNYRTGIKLAQSCSCLYAL